MLVAENPAQRSHDGGRRHAACVGLKPVGKSCSLSASSRNVYLFDARGPTVHTPRHRRQGDPFIGRTIHVSSLAYPRDHFSLRHPTVDHARAWQALAWLAPASTRSVLRYRDCPGQRDPCVWLGRVVGRSAQWIRELWLSAAAGGWVEGGADPAVVGGVEGEAGGDDLVDAVEDVVGEVDVGGGEL